MQLEEVRLNELKAQIRLQQAHSQISKLEEEIRKTEATLQADKVGNGGDLLEQNRHQVLFTNLQKRMQANASECKRIQVNTNEYK